MVLMKDGAVHSLGATNFPLTWTYINRVDPLCQRSWRKHLKNLTRLRVVAGDLFVSVYDPVSMANTKYTLRQNSSEYLEISAGCWFAFKAGQQGAIFFNFSGGPHDFNETVRAKDVEEMLTIERGI